MVNHQLANPTRVYTLEQELEQWGHRADISVVPILFGKEPDISRTTYSVRRWCQDNLKSPWVVKVTRLPVWGPEAAFFQVITLDEPEARKTYDFFN